MHSIRVLIADDHIITRQGIRRLLEDEGIFTVVGEASDGEEAIDMTRVMNPDIIIMDIDMPRVNGIQATIQIKKYCPSIPILILSAYDDDEYIFELVGAGVAGYLLKTASGDELIRAIKAAINGESVLDPVIANKLIHHFHLSNASSQREAIAESLSARETEIIKLAAQGMSNQEIAKKIVTSKRTVEGHMRSIFNKLGVGSRTEAVIYGLKKGWFGLDELE